MSKNTGDVMITTIESLDAVLISDRRTGQIEVRFSDFSQFGNVTTEDGERYVLGALIDRAAGTEAVISGRVSGSELASSYLKARAFCLEPYKRDKIQKDIGNMITVTDSGDAHIIFRGDKINITWSKDKESEESNNGYSIKDHN